MIGITTSDTQSDLTIRQLEAFVVLPIYNEQLNLAPISEELSTVLNEEFDPWKVLFTNGESIDKGGRLGLFRLIENHSNTALLLFAVLMIMIGIHVLYRIFWEILGLNYISMKKEAVSSW